MRMAIWEPDDAVAEALSALRVHDAPPGRVGRIRARYRSELERESRARRLAGRREWLEPAFALGLGALYLAEAVARALAVYR
jgi:hypothetical protein